MQDVPEHSPPVARRWASQIVWLFLETRCVVDPQGVVRRMGLQHSESSIGVPALAQPADWGQPVVVRF